MKVVCESCQAKYQVPDERVAGKKLKIRCKRCGAIILIRGDLDPSAAQLAAAVSGAAPSAPESLAPITTSVSDGAALEWHVSLEGDTRGPFDTETLRAWLESQPGGWDAHVWREGFPDWMDARSCAELNPPAAAPAYASMHEDEGPTQTFQAVALTAAPLMAEAAASRRAGSRASQPGARASSIVSSVRTRSPSGISSAAGPRIGASSHALSGERNEDSVLFSAQSLQTMTGSSSGYTPGPNPGFATGEGSGLIDIRALASLARQSTPQIAPGMGVPAGAANHSTTGRIAARNGALPQESNFSFGNDDELMNQPGTFGRLDSLAPVSNTQQTSNVALPLAIVGGCALVAAAVFAAILIARPSRSAEMVAGSVPGQVQDSRAAASQAPSPAAPEPAEPPGPREPERAAPAEEAPDEAQGAAIPEEPNEDELASGKAKRQPHLPRTATEEKKSGAPEEKAKPKKEEKSEPSSSDDVMLAARAKPIRQAPPQVGNPASSASVPPSKPEPAKTNAADLDALLAAKPPAKPAAKTRSMDDLLSGADKSAPPTAAKPAATAAAPAASSPAADGDESSDLPASPSRDETLAAMRGVESAVRTCAAGQGVTGTAEAELTVAGPTGRVTAANITGITGNVGSCIARAVRNARFPHFTKATFSVKYPYRF
jgi:predicted Zn finger-like uncharacterized protein